MRAATVLVRNLAASGTSLHRWPAAVLTARETIPRGAMQKLAEFAPLLAILAAKPPRTVLDIGTGTGGVFYAWCRVARPDATLVVVDLPGQQGDPPADEATLRSYLKPAQTGHFLWADSHEQPPRAGTRIRTVRSRRQRRPPQLRGRESRLRDLREVHEFWRELKPRVRSREFVALANDCVWGSRWGGVGVVEL